MAENLRNRTSEIRFFHRSSSRHFSTLWRTRENLSKSWRVESKWTNSTSGEFSLKICFSKPNFLPSTILLEKRKKLYLNWWISLFSLFSFNFAFSSISRWETFSERRIQSTCWFRFSSSSVSLFSFEKKIRVEIQRIFNVKNEKNQLEFLLFDFECS